ncbi:unnamed protein product [Microthlaspi erraticum]|uniref:t-SNARE coiled-coil homology domain-containing protein n=1 Tax=Microthlaspi erraticum TaxID=1685480 RepID=A0A6D2HNY8_9BRAS|nr:unnamed protein product [Microthlaspi erraticum]
MKDVTTLAAQIATLMEQFDKGFKEVGKRFDTMDEKFDKINEKVESNDAAIKAFTAAREKDQGLPKEKPATDSSAKGPAVKFTPDELLDDMYLAESKQARRPNLKQQRRERVVHQPKPVPTCLQ